MSWQYDQSSGELRLNGALMGKGYAGTGAGRDNPDMEDVAYVGPIPRGDYDIGPAYSHPSLGPVVMNLDPVGHTARGRTPFSNSWRQYLQRCVRRLYYSRPQHSQKDRC